MRTTLTLDKDVAAQLKRMHEKKKKPFKQLVNEALRLGLQRLASPPPASRPFKTKAVNLGRCLYGSVDDVSEVLAVAEGEGFR
jgi:hypothetical protein